MKFEESKETVDNQLSNLWSGQRVDNFKIPRRFLENTNSNPIQKIKRNIRIEFGAIVFLLLFLFIIPFIGPYRVLNAKFYYEIVVVFVILSIYFFRQFYSFYREINTKNYQIRHNLLWAYYESRLFIELYKTANYVLACTALFLFQRIVYNIPVNSGTKLLRSFIESDYGGVYILILFMIFMEIVIRAWVYFQFEKPVREIKAVLDELEGEEST